MNTTGAWRLAEQASIVKMSILSKISPPPRLATKRRDRMQLLLALKHSCLLAQQEH
jgi:hypothetical protein